MKILITGAAGFIGYHLSKWILEDGKLTVYGLDNMNDYYDFRLKEARLTILMQHPDFVFIKEDLINPDKIIKLFNNHHFDIVVHLAAQAGVRYSIKNPFAYTESNITGFLSVLEACRHHPVKHLVFASTSSVYGLNKEMPFEESHTTDHPISLYAASKKANEVMAHSYAHLYGIPTTGLRFFTVYGPYGRPDMALFKFTKAIIEDQPIDVYNYGEMRRDFTYVDDIVESIVRLIELPPKSLDTEAFTSDRSSAPFRVYNIGSNNPMPLMDFVKAIEEAIGKKAKINMMEMQPGDVKATFAAVNNLIEVTGYKPQTSIEKGIGEFVDWYLEFYKIPVKTDN